MQKSLKIDNLTPTLIQVTQYLNSLDLLEKVSGYEDFFKPSWTVKNIIEEQIGGYWVYISLFAKWEKDEIGYPELKEFLIEEATVSQMNSEGSIELMNTQDCIKYMNNPMPLTVGQKYINDLNNLFSDWVS
jgi:hypothetical protein